MKTKVIQINHSFIANAQRKWKSIMCKTAKGADYFETITGKRLYVDDLFKDENSRMLIFDYDNTLTDLTVPIIHIGETLSFSNKLFDNNVILWSISSTYMQEPDIFVVKPEHFKYLLFGGRYDLEKNAIVKELEQIVQDQSLLSRIAFIDDSDVVIPGHRRIDPKDNTHYAIIDAYFSLYELNAETITSFKIHLENLSAEFKEYMLAKLKSYLSTH